MALTDKPDQRADRRGGLYSTVLMEQMIRPNSIAVVGVSETKDGFGTRALKNLAAAALGDRLVAVSPRATPGHRLFGVQTVARLEEIDGGVDCVLVAVPAAAAEDVVRQAAESGCRSAIVFSSGFAEVSGEGRQSQERMTQVARSHGMLLGGPNTAGVMNYRDGLPLTFMSDLAMDLPTGKLAIVSQSAGIATHLGHIRHRGLGVSYAMTAGNSADVTVLDYVNFALDDDATHVVALAAEGITSAEDFAAVGARSLEVAKPIVMLKSGRTKSGGKAAISHTGSLAGDYDTLLSAAAQAGIIVVDSPEQLVDTASMFAKWSSWRHRGGGPAVITTMGGAGVIAADAADDAGVSLPVPSEATAERLNQIMPAFAATANPIDTTASPTDAALSEVIMTLSEDPAYNMVTVLTATTGGPSTAERPQMIADTADKMVKPMCSVWLSSWQEMPGTEILDRHPRLAVFRSSQRCFTAIRTWIDWHDRLAVEPPTAMPTVVANGSSNTIRARVSDYLDASGALDEARSREFLQAAGIDVPAAIVARSAEEAAAAAHSIGFPVVAKVVSADVPHKAAAGGVALGINSAEEAAAAYTRIVAAVSTSKPGVVIDGVLIARTYDTEIELMAGLVRDPVFGPVILCGAGGKAVEQIADVGRVILPFGPEDARRAIAGLRIHQAIQNSSPERAAALREAHMDVMSRLAQLAEAVPEVGEVDINPLVLRPDGAAVVALDALVVLNADR